MRCAAAAVALLALLGCTRSQQAGLASARKPQLVRGDGVVWVAAAGDISPDAVERQALTAELVLAGGYDAVLLLGDNQYPAGSLENYQRYFHPTWGRFKDRLWPTPGNHEYLTPNAAGYFAYFGARAGDPAKGYYSFDLGSWHLVALNTNDKCRAVPCGEGSEQLKWLAADLAANPKKCTLAFWHHPRFSSGPHGDLPLLQPLWNTLATGGVDVVLNGHDHVYERFLPLSAEGAPAEGGMVAFTAGTGGAPNYALEARRPGSAVADDAVQGVLALALAPEGYAWDFVSLANKREVDRGEGRCR